MVYLYEIGGSKTIKNSNNQIFPIPYYLYMRVTCKLNNELFTLSIVQSIINPLQPGFVCTCKEKSTEVMTSTSAAINNLYQEIFGRKTEYSGPTIMGFYNNNIVEKLLKDIIFFLIFISIESFSVVVTSIGYSDNSEFNGARNGFSSSIITIFQGKQSVLLVQELPPVHLKGSFSTTIFNDHAAEISSWIDRKRITYSSTNYPYEFQSILRVKRSDEILGWWDNASSSIYKGTRDSSIFSLKMSHSHGFYARLRKSGKFSIINNEVFIVNRKTT
ncbi:hypothetical protein Glove_185g44 [Diversispora epigaea]|uniref:TLDc domain-containing protein n=1 Tax=Diversispora epigaea TaxID=1348612 RepID=A0A397IVI2_9GLOM|nr:hypothetical protein Glove_185g44 [Diversispora epigaea]